MSDNMNIKELMELAELREKNPEQYKKVLTGIKEVSLDIMRIGNEMLGVLQNE